MSVVGCLNPTIQSPSTVECTEVAGYECVTPEPVIYGAPGIDPLACIAGSYFQLGYSWLGYDTQSK